MLLSRLSFALENKELRIPHDGNIAVLRAVATPDHAVLPKERLRLFNSFRPAHDRLQAQGYAVAGTPTGEFAATIVNITRSKAETLGLLARAYEVTVKGGLILVDGAKTDGIDSILKRARSVFEIAGSIAKAHGKLFWFFRADLPADALADWRAAAGFSKAAAGFYTAPGMFSPEKIDTGSQLLAAHFDENMRGVLADLGAGWGWLAQRALISKEVERIDLFEAEKTALDAARMNLDDPRARFHWADVQTLTTGAEYDTIISNPPFHQGRSADHSLGTAFIEKAAEMLKPRGVLWLVANRHLPYEDCLTKAFSHWETIEQTPYFKVLRANKPRATRETFR